MKDRSDNHFRALKQIVPGLKRVLLLDYDDENTFHPEKNNPTLMEWKRKNIDNYLMVPNAWKRAVAEAVGEDEDSLFLEPYKMIIDKFFEGQNIQLPRGSNWRDVYANIFSVIDGKKILFEDEDSLFSQLSSCGNHGIKINRQRVARNMQVSELHTDILDFFDSIERLVSSD